MRVIVSPTGKRILVAGLSPTQVAKAIGTSTASASNLLAGKQVGHYQIAEMERERLPMGIYYSLTVKGIEYIMKSNSGLSLLLSQVKGRIEASELSKAMIEELKQGKWNRKRVQQDMRWAIARGLAVQEKISGAIY